MRHHVVKTVSHQLPQCFTVICLLVFFHYFQVFCFVYCSVIFLLMPNAYGIKLCNQTSEPNKCRIFFQRQGWEKFFVMHLLLKIKVFPENMGIGLDKKNKKNIFFHFGGSIRTPPTWGPPKNQKICQL